MKLNLSLIMIIGTFQQQTQSQPQPFQFVQPQNNSQNVEEDEFDEFVGPSTVGSRLASFQVNNNLRIIKKTCATQKIKFTWKILGTVSKLSQS